MQSPSPTPTATSTPTPTATPTQPPVCVTASNYAHVAAGRAYQSGGNTYAAGSNEPLGLYNVFTSHTLRQAGAGTWVVADSGC